jgi:arylsulfatase A
MAGPLKGYACDLVVEEAIHWLDEVHQKGQPFYLNVWFNEPHAKIASPPDLVEACAAYGKDAEYMANIANMDRAIGSLLAYLKDRGLEENTLVLFTSDNGPYRQQSTGPFRGKKSYLYEGGIREPGIIRWPEKITPGQESAMPTGLIDIFPTVAAATGSTMPDDRTYDGESILPLLLGETFERSRPLYWFFYKRYPISALRQGDLVIMGNPKEIYTSPSHPFDSLDQVFFKTAQLEEFQVYNLKDDPGQQKDLYDEDPSRYDDLRSELIKYHRDIVEEGPLWKGLPKK